MFYDLTDESWERAEECRREAERTTNAHDKAAWLLLAEDWLALAQRLTAVVQQSDDEACLTS